MTDFQDAPDAVEWQQVWLGRADTDPRLGYLRQYLKLWLGPRANVEPAPEALQQLPLSIHG